MSGDAVSATVVGALRGRHGASRHGSPRALHLVAARENRRLRRLVGRLRGCLGLLDGRARRLLSLRAGLHGPARSAAATARILHVSARREARFERRAVRALGRSAATGCAGSPACVPYCPVADCMYWIPDEDHAPFGHIEVDPALCIGCKKCVSKGPDGAFLDGCPWDAIEMIPIEDVEALIGFKMPA